MVYMNPTALPRQELQAVLIQGRGINSQNIWKQILPEYPVTKLNGHLINMTIQGAELMRIVDKIIQPGQRPERLTMTFGDQSYTIALRKEEVVVPDEVEKEYDDYFSTEAVYSQVANDKLELTVEYLTAAQIFNTTNFGAATNSAVAYTAANLGTISFIADVYAAIEVVRNQGEEPNTIIIPDLVYQRIRQASLVVAFVRGQLAAQSEVNTNTIQKAFEDEGIEKVLISRSRYNTAAPNATAPSFTKIYPTTYIWVGRTGEKFVAEEGGIATIEGTGALLYWDEFGLIQIQSYRDEPVMSNIVRGLLAGVPYIANTNSGTLIGTQYS